MIKLAALLGLVSAARSRDCATPCESACEKPCDTPCALASLPPGIRAVVVQVACPRAEAHRLRVLGLFEGAFISVVDQRNSAGLLLEVCGSRLAIGSSLGAAIIAQPVT